MNKKLMQIALLIFVIIIWGKVVVDFFSYSKDQENKSYILPESIEKPAELLEEFSYELDLNYRDPFLGKSMYQKKKSTKKQNNHENAKITVKKNNTTAKLPKKPVKWPLIASLGGLSNTNGETSSVILKINGVESLIAPGDSIFGVSLVELTRDSIVLSYQNEFKTLLK